MVLRSLPTTIYTHVEWGVNSSVGEIELLTELPARLFWTNKIKNKFENALQSESTRDAFDIILNTENGTSTSNCVKLLTETILNCASECRRENIPKTKNNARWFDKECSKVKNEIRKLAIIITHSPNNNRVREDLLLTKRTFKNQGRTYKRTILEKMHPLVTEI